MSKASERVKAWRKANPEKYRALRKRRVVDKQKERDRNKRYKQSEAGKAARLKSRLKNRVHENTLANIGKKRRHRADPRRLLWNAAKKRAKVRGLDFSITVRDIHVPTHCPLLGIPLLVNEGTLGPNSPTLDRVFNAYGYVANNILVVSYAANRCKSNLCADEIMKLAVNLKVLEAFRAASR